MGSLQSNGGDVLQSLPFPSRPTTTTLYTNRKTVHHKYTLELAYCTPIGVGLRGIDPHCRLYRPCAFTVTHGIIPAGYGPTVTTVVTLLFVYTVKAPPRAT